MKSLKEFISQEYLALLCIGALSVTLCNVYEYSVQLTFLITCALVAVYLLSEVAHELGHYLLLRRRGYSALIYPLIRTEVISFEVAISDAKLAAVSGPLLGAFTALITLLVTVQLVSLPIYFNIFIFIFTFSHLVMLLPIFPDGRLLRIKE